MRNPLEQLTENPECSICQKEIGLWQPYYTMTIKGHWDADFKDKKRVFCRECFRKYQDFEYVQRVHSVHEQHMKDIKKPG